MIKFRIEFEDDMKYSLNKLATIYWAKRKQLVDDWHYWTEKAVEDNNIKPIKKPVILAFAYQFKKNMLDSQNCATMSKAIEDALVTDGILSGDTNSFVKAVINVSKDLPLKERKHMESHYVDVYIIPEQEFIDYLTKWIEF